jgi:energy-coupling factor transport system substrate-specific component
MSAGWIVLTATIAIVALAVVAMERGGGARSIALVATLGGVAGAGRVLFAAIPSVQPVTILCLLAGATLGVRAGLAVGPIAVLVSNGFLGHGPWTPAQMAIWAAVGASGALLGPAARRRYVLAAAGAAWGLAFGLVVNIWFLAAFGPAVNGAAIALSEARSLPFDIAHAVGNVLIAVAVGPALYRLLARHAARSRVVLDPRAPARAGPAVAGGADGAGAGLRSGGG